MDQSFEPVVACIIA